MREIKFEYIFKDKNSRKLYRREFTLKKLEIFDMNLFLLENNWEILVRRQSTGKKDINSKEIYEGDVVNIKTLIKKSGLASDCLATIGWSSEHCSWELDFISPDMLGKRGMSSPYDDEEGYFSYRILGNIYEKKLKNK